MTAPNEDADEVQRALDLFERFSLEPTRDLEEDRLFESLPADDANHVKKVAEQKLRKDVQDNDHRATFFTFATRLVTGCVAGNFALFIVYIVSQWGDLSDAVMVAWISSTIVEVLGIVVIIAKYLFHTALTAEPSE